MSGRPVVSTDTRADRVHTRVYTADALRTNAPVLAQIRGHRSNPLSPILIDVLRELASARSEARAARSAARWYHDHYAAITALYLDSLRENASLRQQRTHQGAEMRTIFSGRTIAAERQTLERVAIEPAYEDIEDSLRRDGPPVMLATEIDFASHSAAMHDEDRA